LGVIKHILREPTQFCLEKIPSLAQIRAAFALSNRVNKNLQNRRGRASYDE
jgi:hypothetical protein